MKGKIICSGDLITAGTHLNGSVWVQLLSNESDSITVINTWRSGRKTSDKEELIPVLDQNKDAKHILFSRC